MANNGYHGKEGPITTVTARELDAMNPVTEAFIASCPAGGIPVTKDYNGGTQEGAGPTQFTNYKGDRCSTSLAYLRGQTDAKFAAIRRPNLTVVSLCQVLKVVTAKNRAVGVTCVIIR